MQIAQPSSSTAALAVASVLVLSAVGGVPLVADAQSAYISVTNVTHEPQTPTVGDTFQIRLTIQNQGGQNARAVRINEVYARTPGTETYFANDLGQLAPGGSMTVTVPARIDDPGWHTFEVKLNGIDSAGNIVSVKHPVTVRVTDPEKPQLEIDFEDGVVGTESTANVTIANGLSDSIRNLRLELASPAMAVSPSTRVRSQLDSGSQTVQQFTVTPSEAGDQRLLAELQYTGANGQVQTIQTSEVYEVERLDRRVRLDVRTVSGDGSMAEVTVVNLGNAPLEDLAVSADSDDAAVSTALLDRVPARDTRTVRLNVTDITAPETDLRVRVEYEVGGTREEITTSKAASFVPGDVELTGLKLTEASDSTAAVRVDGTASNVGTTDVSAVTVRVRSGGDVAPASVGTEYFVGQIDASDFASFSVEARLADPTTESTIPLAVTYLVDGQRRQTVVNATYEPPTTPDRQQSGPLSIVPGLVAIGAVLVVGAVVWRRRRAD